MASPLIAYLLLCHANTSLVRSGQWATILNINEAINITTIIAALFATVQECDASKARCIAIVWPNNNTTL
jgi:hypothetical protein